METVDPGSSRLRSRRNPKIGALVPSLSMAAFEPKPAFQPRYRAPADICSRRLASCAAMPLAMRGSAMAVQLIPRGVQRARAAPAPQQEDVVGGRVVEAVDVTGRGEDDVVLARGLLALIGVDGAVAADHEEELVAVGVAVGLVTRAGRQHGPAQQQLLRAGRLAHRELHAHADPALVLPKVRGFANVLPADAVSPLHRMPPRVR